MSIDVNEELETLRAENSEMLEMLIGILETDFGRVDFVDETLAQKVREFVEKKGEEGK